jgi:hypothetical protein
VKVLVAIFAFFDLLAAGALIALLFVSQYPESALLSSLSAGSMTCLSLVLALSGLLGVFWLALGARQYGVEQRRPGVIQSAPIDPNAVAAMGTRPPADAGKAAQYARQAQLAAQLSEPARAEALTLLAKQRKIEAIKVVRQDTGLGLKESKDLVDWMEVEYGPN